jgi:DNA replication licensing factor MCM2
LTFFFYDASLTFADNVDLTEPILSRFDVLLTIKDHVDPIRDEQLAFHVVRSHRKSHPHITDEEKENIENQPCPLQSGAFQPGSSKEEQIPQEILRKYILYAKQRCFPKIQQIDQDKMTRMYSELRRESLSTGSIPITVRHLEAVIRLAESHARMYLRNYVTQDDFNMATRVMLESFVSTQKMGILKGMRRTFAKYLNYKKDEHDLLLFLVRQLAQEKSAKARALLSNSSMNGSEIRIKESDLVDKARHLGLKPQWQEFWRQGEMLRQAGYVYDGQAHELIMIQD